MGLLDDCDVGSNNKLLGRLKSVKLGGTAGRHFALEVVGNELIIPGRETGGTDNGLPAVCSETVKAGRSRGLTENGSVVGGAACESEMSCHSASKVSETSSEMLGTEFPILAATPGRRLKPLPVAPRNARLIKSTFEITSDHMTQPPECLENKLTHAKLKTQISHGSECV